MSRRSSRLFATHRIVTISGPAGVGKTGTAVELGRLLAPEFSDGLAFITLAHVTDPAQLMTALADGFDVKEAEGRTLGEGLLSLMEDKQARLILDNLELPGVQLDVGAVDVEQMELVLGAPGEELPQVEGVGLPGAAAVAGQGDHLGIGTAGVVEDKGRRVPPWRLLPPGSRGPEPGRSAPRLRFPPPTVRSCARPLLSTDEGCVPAPGQPYRTGRESINRVRVTERDWTVEVWLLAVRQVVDPEDARRHWNVKDAPVLDALLEEAPALWIGTSEPPLRENEGLRGAVGRVIDLLLSTAPLRHIAFRPSAMSWRMNRWRPMPFNRSILNDSKWLIRRSSRVSSQTTEVPC